jgi:hypothetical protein
LRNPSLLTDPIPTAIVTARQTIIETCKFGDIEDNFLYESIIKWFSQTHPVNDILHWKNIGLLHTLNESDPIKKVEFLFPLLVQSWAVRNSSNFYCLSSSTTL